MAKRKPKSVTRQQPISLGDNTQPPIKIEEFTRHLDISEAGAWILLTMEGRLAPGIQEPSEEDVAEAIAELVAKGLLQKVTVH